jgi:GxxExxY protein
VVDSAIAVHSALGPGLLESAYRACLAVELRGRGHVVAEELPLPATYKGLTIDLGYRLDLVVDGQVVVELKTVTKILPVHEAQILSYLRLGDYRVGLLINFHAPLLRDGLKRFVNRA